METAQSNGLSCEKPMLPRFGVGGVSTPICHRIIIAIRAATITHALVVKYSIALCPFCLIEIIMGTN
jgi:hypothetical protein